MPPWARIRGENGFRSPPSPSASCRRRLATLRADGRASSAAVEQERARIERLVVRARRGAWLSYLDEVEELIDRTEPDTEGELERARRVALEVLQNHDALLKAWNGG
jgi:hypothetical protein